MVELQSWKHFWVLCNYVLLLNPLGIPLTHVYGPNSSLLARFCSSVWYCSPRRVWLAGRAPTPCHSCSDHDNSYDTDYSFYSTLYTRLHSQNPHSHRLFVAHRYHLNLFLCLLFVAKYYQLEFPILLILEG